jgi:hypothetical protein
MEYLFLRAPLGHHGQSFRLTIPYRILCQRHPRHEHHAVTRLCSKQASLMDDLVTLWVFDRWEKIMALVAGHTQRRYTMSQKADRFGSSPLAALEHKKLPKSTKLAGLCQEFWSRI